jgi:hypothetical protein
MMKEIPYPRVAAVIRHASFTAADRLTQLGQKNFAQASGSLKEFLAFYCTVACNEICTKTSSTQVSECYLAIRHAVCDAFDGEPRTADLQDLRLPDEAKLLVIAIVDEPESKFDSYFWAYWNGNLGSLRVSEADIEEFTKNGINRPSEGPMAAAAYALLVRNCRYENSTLKNPPAIVCVGTHKIITEEVANFLQVLRRLL